ncbi:class I SAM-dependent methyltransferase [Pedobacter sp. ASV28]|uniref:class I SAM-dependent methyltransferase n=1 Tax=Pedobacter sp. ASV28 TaxID=2795123 RepID=UPI001E4B2C77|nr:class I SAM-dependent methyltransferase [Pedobacter sp. ASV28]
MHESNFGMTKHTIDALDISNNDSILELGHGNCRHLPEILNRATNISYYGLEISELMQAQAMLINKAAVANHKAFFQLYNGDTIPFPSNSFDKILTVNSIYFWKNPIELLKQLHGLLKPNGLLAIGFADKTFMETLPFTPYGFELYNRELMEALANNAGFNLLSISEHRETIKSKAGEEVNRLFYVATLSK